VFDLYITHFISEKKVTDKTGNVRGGFA